MSMCGRIGFETTCHLNQVARLWDSNHSPVTSTKNYLPPTKKTPKIQPSHHNTYILTTNLWGSDCQLYFTDEEETASKRLDDLFKDTQTVLAKARIPNGSCVTLGTDLSLYPTQRALFTWPELALVTLKFFKLALKSQTYIFRMVLGRGTQNG